MCSSAERSQRRLVEGCHQKGKRKIIPPKPIFLKAQLDFFEGPTEGFLKAPLRGF